MERLAHWFSMAADPLDGSFTREHAKQPKKCDNRRGWRAERRPTWCGWLANFFESIVSGNRWSFTVFGGGSFGAGARREDGAGSAPLPGT